MTRLTSLIAAFAIAGSATATHAATTDVDVDLVFVIDQSSSMGGEFTTLGANIANVLSSLAAATGIGSVQAGLVSYEDVSDGDLTLHQSLTDNATTLSTAFASVPLFGGTEETALAIASVLPGGSLFSALGWRNNTVKSVITITDERGNNPNDYAFGNLTGYEAIGAKLDSVNYLNNIITLENLFDNYLPASRPLGDPGDYDALFSLNDFRADQEDFLTSFINRKITEITTGGTETGGSNPGGNPNVIPLPAAGWLLLAGVAGLGTAARRRRRT